MSAERGFLQQLAAHPKDDTTRLVYADWLDEQGDPESTAKAEFLRVTAELGVPPSDRKKARKEPRHRRLQELAAGLDTDWLAVVSRLNVESCQARRQCEDSEGLVSRDHFYFLYDRHWEEMQPTDSQGARFCDACKEDVHYCDTITVAREHAHQGHCVAVDLGVIRRKRDLEPPLLLMGLISEEALNREEELAKPDAVSAERERRKSETGKTGEPRTEEG